MPVNFRVEFKDGRYQARFWDPRTGFDTLRLLPARHWRQLGHDAPKTDTSKWMQLAIVWAAKEAEKIEGADPAAPEKMGLKRLIEWYVATNPNGVGPMTIAKYEDHAARLVGHFGAKTHPEKIGKGEAAAYRTAMLQREDPLRHTTIKRDLVFLRQVIVEGHQAREKTGVDRIRLFKLPRIGKQKSLIQPLTIEEMKKVLAEIHAACPRDGDRIYRIIVRALTTGLRRWPLLHMENSWTDVANLRQKIPGWAMKGGENRWGDHDFEVPICAWAAEVSTPNPRSRYTWANPRSGRPNAQLDRSLQKIADKAGVRRFGLHALRDTFASLLGDNGVHDQLVQILLGHAAATVTRDYMKNQPNALKEAVAKIDALREHLEPTVAANVLRMRR
jgi:integrase